MLNFPKTRAAGESIKSRTPAGLPGWGPRPGVERSATPGSLEPKVKSPRSGRQPFISDQSSCAIARFARSTFLLISILGFRFAPPQALYYRRASRAQ
jgi:hypothetical protein